MWQTKAMADDLDQALSAVGPRLRTLRRQREITLADLSARTGVSVSTLSRLESGDRKPTLELLLPLARAYGVTLDELVDAIAAGTIRNSLLQIGVLAAFAARARGLGTLRREQ